MVDGNKAQWILGWNLILPPTVWPWAYFFLLGVLGLLIWEVGVIIVLTSWVVGRFK